MKKTTSFIKRVFLILLSVVMCLGLLVSCSKEKPKVEEKPEKVYGIPSTGVGRFPPEPVEPTGITICIDPGHGFEDGGCSSQYFPDNTHEKHITMQVALKLKTELENLGYDTIMTHDGVTIPKTSVDDNNNRFKPEERIAFANEYRGRIDYYFSIHVDTTDDGGAAHGIRLYYINTDIKNQPTSGDIAASVNRGIIDVMGPANAATVVEQRYAESFAVVRETKMPASLIEIGFASNMTDAKNMIDEEWQTLLAKSIAQGIDKYYSSLSED